MAKKPTKDQKLYRNAGVSTLIFEGEEFEPGSEFRATLDPDHELQLLSGGHLEILEDQSARADRAQAEAAEASNGSSVVNEEEPTTRRRARNS